MDSWLNNEFVDENPHKEAVKNAAGLAAAQVCQHLGQLIDDIVYQEQKDEK